MDQQLLLATGGYDHTIRLWTAHNGNCIRTLQYHESSVSLLFTQINDSRIYLAASKRFGPNSR